MARECGLRRASPASRASNVSKMFRLSERLSGAAGPQRRFVNRALLFAGGLVLLWLVVQLLPARTPPPSAPVYADESGTVASKAEPVLRRREPRLVTGGTVFAFVLLAGGGAFALYLRRRTGRPRAAPSFIEPVAAHTLGQGQQLRLVRCGDEVLLLGATNSQITLLKTYPAALFESAPYGDPAVADAPPAAPHVAPSPFADVLRQYAGWTTQA